MGQVDEEVAQRATASGQTAALKKVMNELETKTLFLIKTDDQSVRTAKQCSPMERYEFVESFGIDIDDQERITGSWAFAYIEDGNVKVRGNNEILKDQLRKQAHLLG